MAKTCYLSAHPARGRRAVGITDNERDGQFFLGQPTAAVAARVAVSRGVDDPLSADGAGKLSRRRQRRATQRDQRRADGLRSATGGQFSMVADLL